MDKHAAKNIMAHEINGAHPDVVDPISGEVNMTRLAENTAWEMGHDEWLDDESHWIWDLAEEAAS